MDWLYGKILDSVSSWWAKLSATTLIGLIAFGAAGYRDEASAKSGVPWLIAGAAIGLIAGTLLLLYDYGRTPIGDHESGRRTRWPDWVVPMIAVGIVVCVIGGHFVWTMVRLMR